MKYLKSTLSDELESNILEMARQSADIITQKIKYSIKSLESISRIITKFHLNGDEVRFDDELWNIINDELEENSYLRVGIMMSDGTCYDADGNIYEITPGKYMDKILNRESILFSEEVKGYTTENGLVIGVPLYNRLGNPIACLYAKMGVDNVELTQNTEFLGGTGYTTIADLDGNIIVPYKHTEEDNIKDSSGAVISDGQLYKYIMLNNSANTLNEMKAELIEKGLSVKHLQIGGGQGAYIGVMFIEGYDDYIAVSTVDDKAVSQRLNEVKRTSIAISGVIVAITILVCIYVIHSNYNSAKKIYDIENIDEQTGLYGMKKHSEEAGILLAENSASYSYVIMEINNYKYISGMLGENVADSIIKGTAKAIQEMFPEEACAARISECTFAFMIKSSDEGRITEIIEELFKEASAYAAAGSKDAGTISFTAGVYICRQDDNYNTAHSMALVAKETQKTVPGNSISFYDYEAGARIRDEKEMEYRMFSALENKEFIVYMQPKYEVAGEKMIGAEALVRWEHPDKGLIRPDLFISLFEKNGFISELDMYVLEEVCKKVREWLDKGYSVVPVSVNLSRNQLKDKELVAGLTGIIDKYGIDHNLIEFEITETAVLDEVNYLTEVVNQLKARGFAISMDDFGSGYSSLNMLKKIPVDVLKLDKDFLKYVDSTQDEEKNQKIISHIISMAKDLNMSVLAEGVETVEQKELLKEYKCDMIQGYYYAKPMPMDSFESKYYES